MNLLSREEAKNAQSILNKNRNDTSPGFANQIITVER
jgi:hypothetical protein